MANLSQANRQITVGRTLRANSEAAPAGLDSRLLLPILWSSSPTSPVSAPVPLYCCAIAAIRHISRAKRLAVADQAFAAAPVARWHPGEAARSRSDQGKP
jgi:hypothetical protein